MLIENINVKGIDGDIKINFDKKTGLFSAEFPNTTPSEYLFDTRSDNISDIKYKINEIAHAVIKGAHKVRDVIVVYISSSTHNKHEKKEGIVFETEPRNMYGKGCGVAIKWVVLEEYNLPRKKFIKFERKFDSKGSHNVGIYETVYEKWYKFVEASKYFDDIGNLVNNGKLFRIEAPYASIGYDNFSHLIEYSDEVKTFLLNVEEKMEQMVKMITEFFEIDTNILIDKIKEGLQLSLSAKNEQ